ncbi:hypothetical protein EBU95_12735 [bacterium]|nr:hypothetical protein [bacterium]
MKKKLFYVLIAVLLSNSLEARSARGIIVVATGWGGGVGKIVDYLAERIAINVRSQGGSAKGHRVWYYPKKYTMLSNCRYGNRS